MIDSLKHLPRSALADGALDEQFTDLAPPLTARRAVHPHLPVRNRRG